MLTESCWGTEVGREDQRPGETQPLHIAGITSVNSKHKLIIYKFRLEIEKFSAFRSASSGATFQLEQF